MTAMTPIQTTTNQLTFSTIEAGSGLRAALRGPRPTRYARCKPPGCGAEAAPVSPRA